MFCLHSAINVCCTFHRAKTWSQKNPSVTSKVTGLSLTKLTHAPRAGSLKTVSKPDSLGLPRGCLLRDPEGERRLCGVAGDPGSMFEV